MASELPAVDDVPSSSSRTGTIVIRDPVPSDGVAMPEGWHVLIRTRENGGRTDRYFLDPRGRRYVSRNDVRRALGLPEIPGESRSAKHAAAAATPTAPTTPTSEAAPTASSTSPATTTKRQQQQQQTAPHKTSRVGARFQAVVPELPCGEDGRDSIPDSLLRCLAEAPSPGMVRATVCEPSGTRVWTPDVLPPRVVDDYVARAKRLTSPLAVQDEEAMLALLAANNFDVGLALRVYEFEQATITQAFAAEELLLQRQKR